MNSLLIFTDGACKGILLLLSTNRSSITVRLTLVPTGNRNVEQVAHPAGWGVVAVLCPDAGDDDGLQGTIVAELCGPVLLDPSHENYFGATLGEGFHYVCLLSGVMWV